MKDLDLKGYKNIGFVNSWKDNPPKEFAKCRKPGDHVNNIETIDYGQGLFLYICHECKIYYEVDFQMM